MEMCFYKYFYASFLFISISFSILSCTYCQDNTTTSCFDEFTVDYEKATEVSFTAIASDVVSLVVDVSESVEVGSFLYHVYWTDEAQPSLDVINDENSVLNYNEYLLIGNSLSMLVMNSTLGIMDYDNPNRTEFLQLDLYYEFISVSDKKCQLEIIHNFKDENTKAPYFLFSEYSGSIGEDYPSLFPIYTSKKPEAYDMDATSPNNEFHVIMNPECPLEATESSYTCSEGNPVFLSFWLSKPLNYDTMEPPYQYNCTATLQDDGNPPLSSSSSSIILKILPIPDEDPVFSSSFYKGNLVETYPGSVVRVIPNIEAVDLDISPSPQKITYSMTPTDDNGTDEYFSINSSTGEVSLIKDIDDYLLALKYVSFILMACDEDEQCGKSLLTINLPVQSSPNSDSLQFDKDIYSALITTLTYKDEFILQVHAQSTNNQEQVTYYFVDDNSPGLQYFKINQVSGKITTSQDAIPTGHFELTTGASDGSLTDVTMVIIDCIYIVTVDESYTLIHVLENLSSGPIYQVKAEGAIQFCILDIQPEYFKNDFNILSNGTIIMARELDADTKYGNLVFIKAGAYLDYVECLSTNSSQILMNEVLVKVEIDDLNDNDPYFVDPAGKTVREILYAYPTDYTLQRAIGPVAKVLARDEDITPTKLNYRLSAFQGYNSDDFEVDYYSGEIYLTGKLISTKFYISVSDTSNTEFVTVYIDILEPSYISSMYFDRLNESELERKIFEVSDQADVPVYLLYSNYLDDVYGDGFWKIEAHVYSTDDMEIIDWEELKDKLDDIDIVVKPFSEENLFYPDDDDNGYKTATIVLGCICGLYLLVAVAYLIYTLCKNGEEKKAKNI